MPRPKIVNETKRETKESEPPPGDSCRPHQWLSEDSTEMFGSAMESRRCLPLYVSELAEKKIREHALEEAPRRLEVMGFLLGDVSVWKGVTYVDCRDVVTTKLRSSSSKVRFSPDAFPNLFLQLDDSGFDYILVGWYHSHPGHTCFLSRTDLDTQRSMFDQPFHVALVIDPVNEAIKAFKLTGEGNGYEEVPFAVYSQRAAPRPKSRTRKLKVKPLAQGDPP